MLKVFFRSAVNLWSLIIVCALLFAVVFCFWWQGRPTKATLAVAEVKQIVDDIHRLYSHKANYWQLDNSALQKSPRAGQYRYRNQVLVNKLNKPILIGSGENGDPVMPAERSFDVVFSELSKKECIYVASYQFEQPENLGLLQITIIAKGQKYVFAWGEEEEKLPVSKSKAYNLCSNDSKVIWNFE